MQSLKFSDVSIFCIVCNKIIFIRRTVSKRANEVYCELNMELSSTEENKDTFIPKNYDLPRYTSITIHNWNQFSNIWGETSKKTLSLKKEVHKGRSSVFLHSIWTFQNKHGDLKSLCFSWLNNLALQCRTHGLWVSYENLISKYFCMLLENKWDNRGKKIYNVENLLRLYLHKIFKRNFTATFRKIAPYKNTIFS